MRHIAVSFAVLLLPLVALYSFSLVSDISFKIAFFDLFVSTLRLAIAFAIAVICAWLMVVLLVRGKTESTTLAVFDVMQSLPTFAILPIAVHYFGTSNLTIIFFLVTAIIWPIVFSIVSSLKQADKSWHEAVAISRIGGFSYVRLYLLPVTLPGITTGAIIGLGEGWEALIATELLVNADKGLGSFFLGFANNSTMTFLGVLVFLSFIFALNKLIWLPLLEKSHHLVEQ